jgi:acyl-CoA thioesterase FadM
MQVPPKDVDMYGVVQNTVYQEYMYKARKALLESAGFSVEALLQQYGVMTATSKYTIHYKRYAGCCSTMHGSQML